MSEDKNKILEGLDDSIVEEISDRMDFLNQNDKDRIYQHFLMKTGLEENGGKSGEITEEITAIREERKINWIKYVAAAACIVFVAGGFLTMAGNVNKNDYNSIAQFQPQITDEEDITVSSVPETEQVSETETEVSYENENIPVLDEVSEESEESYEVPKETDEEILQRLYGRWSLPLAMGFGPEFVFSPEKCYEISLYGTNEVSAVYDFRLNHEMDTKEMYCIERYNDEETTDYLYINKKADELLPYYLFGEMSEAYEVNKDEYIHYKGNVEAPWENLTE